MEMRVLVSKNKQELIREKSGAGNDEQTKSCNDCR